MVLQENSITLSNIIRLLLLTLPLINQGVSVSAQVVTNPLQETGIGVSNQNQNYDYNMGYRFTADNDGNVTQLGGRWKTGIVHTVRLYAYPAGTLLAQVNVTGSMSWSYANISPVSITAGSQYVVAVRLDAQSSGVNTVYSTPVASGGVTITNSSYLAASNAMPTNNVTTYMYGQADITFSYTPCTYAGDITADSYQINTGDSTNLYVTNNVGDIQWQSSPDSIVFTNIPGATNDTLNSGPLTVTTYYRTYITGGSCGPDTSDIVKIKVVNPEYPLQYTGLGITSQNQNWNYNMGYRFTPSVNGQVTELGGRWKSGIVHTVRLYDYPAGTLLAQASVTGSMNWSYVSISPVSLDAGSQYVVAVRLDAQSSGVSTNFTTPVVSGQVTINNSTYLINSNNMPTNVITNIMYGQADIRFQICAFAGDVSAAVAEVCPGNSTTVNVTGNVGDIQWQSSSDNITYTDIPGETGSVLNTGPLSAKTYYRTYVTGGGCGPDTSNIDSVAVTGPGGTPGLWTASADNNWSNLCNWDNAVVPLDGDSAIIPSLVSPPVNIPEISLKYLEMNNAAGIGLINKMIITEELKLTAGNIITGSDTLVIGANAIITGGVSTSYVQVDGTGTIRKNYAIANGSTFTFPIGDVNDYSPATYDLNTGSALGADPFITINITDASHPNIGNPNHYITRYWTIKANDITSPDFDVTFIYVNEDVTGTESSINTQEFVSSAGWSQYNPTNASTNTLSGNNLTAYGDFTGSDAVVIVSTQTGSWNTGSTWLGGVAPVFTNNVSIEHNVSLADNDSINNIAITAGGTLNAAGYKLSVKGNFTNNGSFDGTGEIEFSGTSSQSIAGSVTTFGNLTINNLSGVNITSGTYNLTGTLTLTRGAFSTNNALTLISDASGTARIARITGGSITGNITMQRFVPAGPNSWRFLSSPVSGRTLADWDDNFATSGFPGSDDPAFGFTSIYTYDETTLGIKDNGYTAPSGIGDAITVGKGYWVYLGPLPLTFDVTGTANTGNKSLPVTYTDDPAQPASEDGWNMVGNPYPSTIDWDASGWTKSKINSTIYIFKNDGSYSSYPAGGPGVNGGSRYIASSQAFWIQTNGTSPALSLNESVKAEPDQTFLKVSGPESIYDYLSMTVTGNGYSDETVIRFIPDAIYGLDNYDAYKLLNQNTQIPNISTVVDTYNLVINSIPGLTQDIAIPVRVTVGVSGLYSLSVDGLSNISSNTCVLFEDTETGNITDLKTDSSYTFTISDSTTAPRFLLHFTIAAATFTVNKDTVYLSEGGTVQFTNNSTGASSYQWNFGDGTPVNTSTNPAHSYTGTGTYTVTLIAINGACQNTFTYNVVVLDNPPVTIRETVALNDRIKILSAKNWAIVEFNFDRFTELSISVCNLLGQKVIADNNIRVKQDRIKLDLPVRGIYFIKIVISGKNPDKDENIFTRKLIMR